MLCGFHFFFLFSWNMSIDLADAVGKEHCTEASVQFSSAAQSCLTLWDPMDCSTPGFPILTNSWRLLKLMSIESVMPSNHLILCHPLLLLPSIFPNIRVFSNESVLRMRWPKDWSSSFNISPSNEHSGLISFRMDPNRQMLATKQPWCFLHGFHDFLTAFDY